MGMTKSWEPDWRVEGPVPHGPNALFGTQEELRRVRTENEALKAQAALEIEVSQIDKAVLESEITRLKTQNEKLRSMLRAYVSETFLISAVGE
jgi:cell shape-determining protein MreC